MNYDAENRIASVMSGSTTLVSYKYDGDGRRVQKTTPSGTTTYVYDNSGALMAEYIGTALSKEYVRFHSSFIGSNVDLVAIENAPGSGAPCTTCFVIPDYLGNVRMMADNTGRAISRHDYLPFGEEASADPKRAAAAGFGSADGATQRFTGKEGDQESGLDYFGARYYGSALGRFTSPDVIDGNLSRLLNPQRWNKYAYVVNNPLAFTDPDGKDAIAVGFSKLASGLGHAAVISVHKDGTAEYGDFGPVTAGRPADAGKYNIFGLKTKIEFDSKGLPTQQSLASVTKEVAGTENQPESSVSLAYYKTSDAETAALDAFLKAALDRQAQGKTPGYYVGFRDCINFCMAGMQRAGIGQGSAIGSLPNVTIGLFEAWADASYDGATGKRNTPKEDVKSTFHPCSPGDTSPGCSQ